MYCTSDQNSASTFSAERLERDGRWNNSLLGASFHDVGLTTPSDHQVPEVEGRVMDKEGKNQMRNSDGLRVGADLTKQQRDTVIAQEQRKACILCKGEAGSARIPSIPPNVSTDSTHDQNRTKHPIDDIYEMNRPLSLKFSHMRNGLAYAICRE